MSLPPHSSLTLLFSPPLHTQTHTFNSIPFRVTWSISCENDDSSGFIAVCCRGSSRLGCRCQAVPPCAYIRSHMYTLSFRPLQSTGDGGDVILSAAATGRGGKRGGRERVRGLKEAEDRRRDRRQQERKTKIKMRRGEFSREDFLWWDRGIILLRNYEEPCTVLAWGQLHAPCRTACVDIANVNHGAAEQVIVLFPLLQTVWLMCLPTLCSAPEPEACLLSMGIIREGTHSSKSYQSPAKRSRGITTEHF